MPASKRRTQGAPRQRAQRPDGDQGQDQDGGQPSEPPTPERPGEPVPAVPAPDRPEGYRPVLPPLGEAILEAREADGEVAAEQLARPSAGLASVRQHLGKLMTALEKLQQRRDD